MVTRTKTERRIAATQHPYQTVTGAASNLDPFTGILNRPFANSAHLWAIYDRLGELNYGVGFKAHAAERLAYFVGVREDAGQDPDPETADPAAVKALAELQGPFGGAPQIMAELVTQLEVVGEGVLIGEVRDRGGFGSERVWEVWSDEEYRAANFGSTMNPDQAQWSGDQRAAVRIWRQHPRNGASADSPLKHAVDVAEQLILLSDFITAVTRSRLTAGILFLPEGLSIPGQPSANGIPPALRDLPEPMRSIIHALTSGVKDTNAASRLVPTVVQGRMQDGGTSGIETIDLIRDLPDWVVTLIESAQRRFAVAMDLPAEVITGLADVNHWTAWQVDESAYRQHVDPTVRLVMDSVTRGYLWPTLLAGGMNKDLVRKHVIWRDFSDLVAKQDSIQDAMEMFDRKIVLGEYVRRVSGANESDAPPEVTEDATLEVRDLKLEADAIGVYVRAGFLPPSAIEAVMTGDLTKLVHTGLLPITVKDEAQVEGEGVTGEITPVETAPEPPALPERPAAPGPPAVAAANLIPLDKLARIDANLFTRLEVISQTALDRAVEKAGAKIRRQVERQQASNRPPANMALASMIDGQANLDVGVILGRERVMQLALSDEELIPESAFNTLENAAARMLLDSSRLVDGELEKLGAQPAQEQDRRTWITAAVLALAVALRAIAFRRLYTPKPGVPDPAETGEITVGIVPASEIWATMTLAAGGIPGPDLRLRGLGLSEVSVESLADAGYRAMQYRWDYQGFLPRQTFEPHLRLNGVEFASPDDEVLRVGEGGSWLGRQYYSPGDHSGCRCIEVPIVEVSDDAV